MVSEEENRLAERRRKHFRRWRQRRAGAKCLLVCGLITLAVGLLGCFAARRKTACAARVNKIVSGI